MNHHNICYTELPANLYLHSSKLVIKFIGVVLKRDLLVSIILFASVTSSGMSWRIYNLIYFILNIFSVGYKVYELKEKFNNRK